MYVCVCVRVCVFKKMIEELDIYDINKVKLLSKNVSGIVKI